MSRFLQAEIDLKALINNFQEIKTLVKRVNSNIKIIAIVKADAYGHGAVEISKALENQHVDFLGVAFFEEALILRESGIKSLILLLFDREVEGVFKHNLIPVIFDIEYAKELSREAQRRNTILPVHIKVETGMGRLGIHDNITDKIKEIAKMPNLRIEGIMSHLSQAEDFQWTMKQVNKLKEIKENLKDLKINPLFHISNSAGLYYTDAIFDAIRPGIMLYGYNTKNNNDKGLSENALNLTPCMTVKTKILDIRKLPKGTPISYGKTFITKRESLIGVVPIGYADGYFRILSNKAKMIVKGKRANVVGTVCMDLTMIDLTEIPDVSVGDEVIILGFSGNEKITAWDIANWANTIPYEVLTSLGSKAKRKYKNNGGYK
ncbi:MAG: alanine racemase [Thermodesulfovibrio sp.]|uniref:alanine racemase n=1 Tax=unclassified Thermodesulfovibrio TaxID=2645936 RepID=UPI00083A15F0|nr:MULTISPECIES: alanine racemase [unclassified Thermodesulfovibrio]MDI1471280.1 alanine racemase [Thermodesulfovibrio sp. 1176]MDI6714715.1 alanine racemase [Thermodesulfovibrio sp.]ODA44021.1 Alanine racemase [Thermodesulfovibrio sp. N1]